MNSRGEATYTVDITQAGEHVLWGRVIAPRSDADSFYVEAGGSPNNAWQVAGGSSWHWDKVNIKGGVDPVTYYLQAGINTIVIDRREDGTKLDKLLLTDDMDYIPTGAGEDDDGGNDGGSTSCNNAWDKIMTTDRFELVMGGEAIKDNETCLVWEQSPNTSERSWTSSLSHCFTKKVGGRKGWRAPTIEELATLVDETESSAPKIPAELKTLTSNVQSALYWSSTTYADTTLSNAWFVHFIDGFVGNGSKIAEYYVWCVRGGQGHDAY